jgi:hypothetical protein
MFYLSDCSHRMSGNILILKNQFINKNAPLGNGIARFIPQLARMTIKVKNQLILGPGIFGLVNLWLLYRYRTRNK